MCGLVTIVTPSGGQVSSSVLQEMTTRLAHRGPDDCGYACVDPLSGMAERWSDSRPDLALSGVVFGHRRLGILDLTPNGSQPMVNDDGSMILAFNGEIYNYLELRAELQAKGAVFRGRSDTEVLLRAYEHWGTSALGKFNGMWAFTLWDGRQRKLVASRDRFGVKPLYYTVVDGTWVLASEIKSLLAFPRAFRGFRGDRVRAFVHRAHIDCDEDTLFNGIHAVPPGTCLEIEGEKSTRRTFWSLRIDDRFEGRSAESLVSSFADLLGDSVRLRLRSDVPIGTMLSGGLDSTSIAALIHEQRMHQRNLPPTQESSGLRSFHHTITACWPGWLHDEEAQVDALCAKLGLRSHKCYVSPESMADVLYKVAYHLDEPFESPTALVQYLLMKTAREVGVTVVLNGHGSDEVLAGYPVRFVPPFLADRLLSGHPLQFLNSARQFRKVGEWSVRQLIEELRRGAPRPSDFMRTPTRLASALWDAFSARILPMWLRMEDRVSMACSIESRLPFLDYRLVEFAFNLPDDLKLRNGYTKFILREAMQARLPNDIVWNRRKTRFASPFGSWFRQGWRRLLEDNLLGPCQLQSHVDLTDFQARLRKLLNGSDEAVSEDTVWRVLNAEVCLRTFGAG